MYKFEIADFFFGGGLFFKFFTCNVRAGIVRELASRADQGVLRWFGHVERMDEYRMVRRVFMSELSGGRVRGLAGWMV